MTTNLIYRLNQSKSPLRKKLLAYFFTNPEAELYLREIALRISVDPANLSRELARLEEEGLFASRKKGLQKYFRLNKAYSLYRELKSIISKTIGVEGAIEQLFRTIPGIQRAFIYGSFAKNSEHAGSDVDLCLVIRRKEFKEHLLLEGIHDLERELGREINYIFFTREEWQSKQHSKDSFILGLLKNKRIELIHEN